MTNFMRLRPLIWIGLFLLLLAGAWLFWSSGQRAAVRKHEAAARQAALAPSSTSMRPGSTAPQLFAAGKAATNSTVASARTNRFAWRLNNTSKTLSQLMNDPHGILLENAFIDTGAKLNLAIPSNLKASGDPGAYIVQSRGPVDNAFRAQLTAAGAEIVSYVPNNAYLVTLSAGGAAALTGQPGVQTVLPYEPYYKLPASLMPYAGKSFPVDRQLRVAAYPNTADAVRTWLENSGPNGPQILAEQPSPFGTTFIVQNVTDVAALVQQRIIQRAEPVFRRVAANDLARVTLGISADTVTPTNYMNLSGKNVLVEVNDTGIDANHPDFSLTGTAEAPGSAPPSRVIGFPFSLVDTNGHGTHVAGIIAGNGSASYSVTTPPQGSVLNADFRGKAPLSSLYSFAALNSAGDLDASDYYLQSVPATNNALISNNSWNYDGDSSYNLAAASYDAAVRDALPFVTGSQPVLFVFSAGNDGGGNDDGSDGDADTILSPATAKRRDYGQCAGTITEHHEHLYTVGLLPTKWLDGWQLRTAARKLQVIRRVAMSALVRRGILDGSSRTWLRRVLLLFQPGRRSGIKRPITTRQIITLRCLAISLSVPIRKTITTSRSTFIPPNITFNSNIVAVSIQILPNASSPIPFPNLPIYVSHINFPNPAVPGFIRFC